VHLVEDRVLVPEGIAVQLRLRGHPESLWVDLARGGWGRDNNPELVRAHRPWYSLPA
jgi:hypothetical protein